MWLMYIILFDNVVFAKILLTLNYNSLIVNLPQKLFKGLMQIVSTENTTCTKWDKNSSNLISRKNILWTVKWSSGEAEQGAGSPTNVRTASRGRKGRETDTWQQPRSIHSRESLPCSRLASPSSARRCPQRVVFLHIAPFLDLLSPAPPPRSKQLSTPWDRLWLGSFPKICYSTSNIECFLINC